MDLGCVNPDPAGTSPDPAACRRAGYTSIGQNRIFGNSRNSKTHTPLGEIALQGPGAMMAQGNYFGDIAPADGKGDALGECHVLIWPEPEQSELPPVRADPQRALRAVQRPRARGSRRASTPGSTSRRTRARRKNDRSAFAPAETCGLRRDFAEARRGEDPAVIGKTLGHYQVTAKLGEGGMGEVYRARDEHLDRDVALKVLPPGMLADETARRRFRREAEALSRLNHAHIATVHDFDSSGGIDFLVMEYVPGQTLSQHIAGRPLPEKEVATLGSDVAAALEEAHERGVVHRDLKPANIIVSPKGRVKVLDFGLAQLSGTAADVEQTTTRSESGFEGTLPYMAPEQVRGEAIDARTDVYALGVVLYEMATGRRPFDDTQTGRLTDAILHAPLTPPTELQPGLNPELERIISKCLERDPENRYQSAKEVAIDLRRLGSPTTTHHASPRTVRARCRERRWHWDWAALAVAVAAGCSGWGNGSQDDRPAATTAEGIASIVALPSKVVGAGVRPVPDRCHPQHDLGAPDAGEGPRNEDAAVERRSRAGPGRSRQAGGRVRRQRVRPHVTHRGHRPSGAQRAARRGPLTTPDVEPRFRGAARQLPRAGTGRRRRAARRGTPAGRSRRPAKHDLQLGSGARLPARHAPLQPLQQSARKEGLRPGPRGLPAGAGAGAADGGRGGGHRLAVRVRDGGGHADRARAADDAAMGAACAGDGRTQQPRVVGQVDRGAPGHAEPAARGADRGVACSHLWTTRRVRGQRGRRHARRARPRR